jgi:dihydroorotase-like cyclic amidohydrolase
MTKKSILLRNCTLVNEGIIQQADILVQDGLIRKIGKLTDEIKDLINNLSIELQNDTINDINKYLKIPNATKAQIKKLHEFIM